MSSFDFDFSAQDPADRKVWYTLPAKRLDGSPFGDLEVCYAGPTNKKYTNRVAQLNAAKGSAARRLANGVVNADVLIGQLDVDRRAMPGVVVSGWRVSEEDPRGILNREGGEPVPFSEPACAAFLDKIPHWLMQRLSNFTGSASNFLPEGAPTEDEVEETAGN